MLLSELVRKDQERYNDMSELERLGFESTKFQMSGALSGVVLQVISPVTIVAGGVTCAGYLAVDSETKLRQFAVTNVYVRPQ